ncbi:MAG: YraN family protein [Bacteroidetes bacterium]|nr:YraN family protein [Bacteroidota bacterium]
MNTHNKNVGNKGESIAEKYLIDKGYSIIEKNFHFGKEGEIDIIATDKNNVLVFIEVKTRTNHNFGHPLLSITEKKKRSIRFAANGYMLKHNITNQECRIDFIAIDMITNLPDITHLENVI